MRTCGNCGISIEHKRQDAKWCSPKCGHEKYHRDNSDKLLRRSATWRKENRERALAYGIKYHQEHKEAIAKRGAKWQKENPGYSAEWYRENPGYKAKWRKENPEKYGFHAQRRRTRKLSLPSTLTHYEWGKTLLAFDGKCVYCGDPWEHQDHLIPVALGGGYTKENIVPACEPCNLSKGASHPADWVEEDKLEWILETVGLVSLPTVYIVPVIPI